MDEDWDDFTAAPIVPIIAEASSNVDEAMISNDGKWNGVESVSNSTSVAPVSIEDEVEPVVVVACTNIDSNGTTLVHDDERTSVASVSIEDEVEPVVVVACTNIDSYSTTLEHDDEWTSVAPVSIEDEVEPIVVVLVSTNIDSNDSTLEHDDEWNGVESVSNSTSTSVTTSVAPVISIEDEVEPVVVANANNVVALEVNDDEWNGVENVSNRTSTSVAPVSIEDEVEPVEIVASVNIDNNDKIIANDDEENSVESVSNSTNTSVTTSLAPVSIEDEVEPVVVVASTNIDSNGTTLVQDDERTSVAPVSIEDEVEPVVVANANNMVALEVNDDEWNVEDEVEPVEIVASVNIDYNDKIIANDDEWNGLSVAKDSVTSNDITFSNSDSNTPVFSEPVNDVGILKSDGDDANDPFIGEDDEWADFETAPVEIEASNVSVSEVVIDSSALNSEFNSDTIVSTAPTPAFVSVSTDDESVEINALKRLGVSCNFDTKHYMSIRELIAPLYLSHLSGALNNNGICPSTVPTSEVKDPRNISVDLHIDELPKLITDKNTIEYICQIIAATIPSDALPLSQIEMPVSSHTRRTSVSLEGLLLTPLNSPKIPSKYDTANKNATNSNDDLDITTDFLVSHLTTSNKTSSGDDYDMSYMETSHSTGSSYSPSRSTSNSTKSSVIEANPNNVVEAFLKSIPNFSFMLR